MKCLENLALIDDAHMEELQKDIEELIASYLNIRQICYNMLDEIQKKNPKKYEIEELIEIFREISIKEFDESCFYTLPEYITSYKELMQWIENDCRTDVKTGIYLGMKYEKEVSNLINEKEGYWIYREGTNWELIIDTKDKFFNYLKSIAINIYDKDNQVLLLRQLKEFTKNY